MQAGEQVARPAAAAVGVLSEEVSQAFFAQARGARGGRIAGEERQGDRGIDVGKDASGAGPDALEEGAQLIGQRHALGDEIVAAAHEGPQGARVIRRRLQGAETMAVGAEEIGQQEGIAGVTLAAGGGIPGAGGFHHIRVDRHDLETCLNEGVNQHARGAFDGNRQRATVTPAPQALHQSGQTARGVRGGAAPADAAAAVDHAHRVSLTRPIETDEEAHCAPPGDRETLRRERSGRSLTDWRSGLARHLALHPVAGLGLSSFVSGERVSRGPSSGERVRLSPISTKVVQ